MDEASRPGTSRGHSRDSRKLVPRRRMSLPPFFLPLFLATNELTLRNLSLLTSSHSPWSIQLPPHMFIKGAPNSHGFVDSDVTLKLWKKHFTYFYREYDWFCFPLTLHPDVSGRPHMLLILEE